MTKTGLWFAAIIVTAAVLSPNRGLADDAPMLSWRGLVVGMTRTEAVERLRDMGFRPQAIQWGGRQRENWEGTIAAFGKSGECTGEQGEQCEEAFLSIVRNPSGDEIVWVISAYSHLAAPIYVDRLLAPAFDRFGNRYIVDWGNGYKMPNGTVQFRLWNGHWFPNGTQDRGEIKISAAIFPRQTIDPADPVPPVPDKDARSWGVNVVVSDPSIRARIQKEYDDRDRNMPPPIQY